MLTELDRAAAARTVASLRAACELLRVSAGRVSAVSLRGRLPEGDRSVLPVLSAAERLGTEYEYAVTMLLDGRMFEIRFRPRDRTNPPAARA